MTFEQQYVESKKLTSLIVTAKAKRIEHRREKYTWIAMVNSSSLWAVTKNTPQCLAKCLAKVGKQSTKMDKTINI